MLYYLDIGSDHFGLYRCSGLLERIIIKVAEKEPISIYQLRLPLRFQVGNMKYNLAIIVIEVAEKELP